MYCRKCGSEIADDCKFCSKCGTENLVSISTSEKTMLLKIFSILKSRKYVALIATVVFSIVLLIVIFSSIKTGGVSKKQICDDITHYASFEDYNLDIIEYNEEKRDTNREQKYDQIWVNIAAENENIRFTGSYIIMYKLYNDGWSYEYVDTIQSDYVALEELDESRIKEDIMSEFNDLITVYKLDDISIDVTLPEDIDNLKNVVVRCIATAKNDKMTAEGVIYVTYELKMNFDFCGWQMTECDMIEYSYCALTEPSNELLKKTTDGWEEGITLVKSEKTDDNEYIYVYDRMDKNSFKGIEVEWNTTLKYSFSPEKGWTLSDTVNELKNAIVTAKGTWVYDSGDGDCCTLKINSVDKNKINFDIDITWTPAIWGSAGTPQTFTKTGMEMTWTYTYNEAGYITFTSDEAVTRLNSSLASLYSFSPKLVYEAHLDTKDSSVGYMLDYWDLEEK